MKEKLAVVQVTREYGGPEEGGWWYDARTLLAVRRLRGKKKNRRIRRSLRREWGHLHDPQPISNYHSEGQVRFHEQSGNRRKVEARYNQERPHYE